MSNWNEWKDLVFQATEATDKHIYRAFINTKKPKDSIRLMPQEVLSYFDLLQITDNSKDIVELKTRHRYTYEQFDDISINLKKIQRIMERKEDVGANNVYICAMYPKSDKIVLIDITYIDYNEDNVVNRNVKLTTLTDKPYKVMQQYIPLSIKRGKDPLLNTRTYVFTYKKLFETYVKIFKKYCKKYNVPDDMMAIGLQGLS